MELSLGIRLVIILPTFLFLVGFSFKSIIERKSLASLKKNLEKEKYGKIWDDLWDDYLFVLAIDSIFLFIANGLIIIFELGHTEIGIIAVIVGVMFFMCLLIGIYAHSDIEVFGILAIFSFLGGEFAYFCSYGSGLEVLCFIIGVMLGFLVGNTMIPLAIPKD